MRPVRLIGFFHNGQDRLESLPSRLRGFAATAPKVCRCRYSHVGTRPYFSPRAAGVMIGASSRRTSWLGQGGIHEDFAADPVDRGGLCGRGVRGNDAAANHNEGAAAALPAASAPAATPAPPPPNPNAAATAADHRHMMEQLGITALRPGPSGNESAPNHANYDEALANPYPEPARGR